MLARVVCLLIFFLLAGCSGAKKDAGDKPSSDIAEKIAKHKYWKKPLTEAQVTALAEKIRAAKKDHMLLIGPDGTLRSKEAEEEQALAEWNNKIKSVTDVNERLKLYPEHFGKLDVFSKEKLKGMVTITPGNRWDIRPSVADVLEALLEKLDMAEYDAP